MNETLTAILFIGAFMAIFVLALLPAFYDPIRGFQRKKKKK